MARPVSEKAILYIGGWSSRCGVCGKSTLPSQKQHIDISGYSPIPGGGCGATFTHIRSEYYPVDIAMLQDMRPDLIIDHEIADL